MSWYDSKARHLALSMVIAALIVSSGCSSLLADGGPPSTPTEGPNQQDTATPATESNTPTPSANLTEVDNSTNSTDIRANGTDLRSVTIPENASEQYTYYGEIDGNDSVINGTEQYYEAVLFAAEAGDQINVTMSSIANDPELRIRAPNGTTIATNDDSADGNNARFEMLQLNQTGQYTLVAAAAEPNTGFDYTLTVERYIEPNFQGNMSEWDEQSRYLHFSEDYSYLAQGLSGGVNGPSPADTLEETEGNLTAYNWTVYTEEDYVVIGYIMSENATPLETVDVDTSLINAYTGIYELYGWENTTENRTWIPDRIYHVGYNYTGEVYRTSYVDREWAVEFYEDGALENDTAQLEYYDQYLETLRTGPAHENYMAEGGTFSVTPNETVVEEYENTTADSDTDEAMTARP